MMALPLAGQLADEAKSQKLIETYRLAQIRTAVVINDVQLVERKGDKAHVRLSVSRQRTRLFSSENVGPLERQSIDLILAEVPRTRRRPDGLEVLEWHTRLGVEGEGAGGSVTSQSPGGGAR